MTCYVYFGYSQSKIGMIVDEDGFTNIRANSDLNSEVIGKVKDKEYISYFKNDDSNWWIVETKNNLLGYIHKSRISFVKNGYLLHGDLSDLHVTISVKNEKFKALLIKIYQLKSDENPYIFSCRAYIRILKAGKVIDEISYNNIDPVGGNYGISYEKNQTTENHFIASKFGDYQGEVIIVNKNGMIQNFKGGHYFLAKNEK